jgi:hypothetical protein
MTSVYVPVDLPRLVKEKFDAAKEAGDLSFWPTKVAILKVNDFSVSSPVHIARGISSGS